MDYIKIEDIPEEFVGLANFMGIDKFIEFCNEYGGIAIYFPSKKTLLRNGRNREIIKRYNGKNIKDLARAFEISEVQVRNIIRTSGKCIINKKDSICYPSDCRQNSHF